MRNILPYVFESFTEWDAARAADPSLEGFSVDRTRSQLGITEGHLGEMLLRNELRTSYIYDQGEFMKQVIRRGDVLRALSTLPVA